MLFALPAACLAMYHEAHTKNKKIAAGILFSAALTCFLTGITEPVEFTFIFVAPILYVFNAIMAGLAYMTMYLLHAHIANRSRRALSTTCRSGSCRPLTVTRPTS
jgi:PTS system D-glucosamine-specific IIC component